MISTTVTIMPNPNLLYYGFITLAHHIGCNKRSLQNLSIMKYIKSNNPYCICNKTIRTHHITLTQYVYIKLENSFKNMYK